MCGVLRLTITSLVLLSCWIDHHALLPTEQSPRFEKLSNEEQKIYQLIVQRFLGLYADNHQTAQKNITVQIDNQEFLFRQTVVVKDGWKKSDDAVAKRTANWQEGAVVAGQLLINKELTAPPKPLTEASLLGAMEKFSLGTPATRAEIIEKLIKSELMERTANGLQVTPKGKQLLELVNPSLVTPDLTAKWELELEKIAQGKASEKQFILNIEKDTKRLVNEIKESKSNYQDFSITQKKCPECGANLREKNSRDGKMYVCTNTDCSYRRRKDRSHAIRKAEKAGNYFYYCWIFNSSWSGFTFILWKKNSCI